MKNSGIEWIGEIPEDWDVGPVKYFYTIQTGFTPLTQNEKYYDENGAIWVTIADITQCNKYIVDSKSKISNFYLEQYSPKETPVGSLLYSFKLSIGVTAFAGVPLYTNEAIASFINTEFVNLGFLYYSSFLILYNANTNIYGAKLLNQELIKNALIVFPPIAEQQRIADYLDKKCAAVDRLMENQRLQIEKLKEYKQSLITEVVTKGLDKTVPLKSSGVEWIGDIPEGWKVCRIKDLFELRNERNYEELSKVNLISLYTELGVMQHADIEETTGNKAVKAEGYKLVYKNDIVVNIILCWMGAVGKSNYNGVTSPAYDVYKPNSKASSNYYHYLFRTAQFNGECYRYGRGIMMMRWRTYSSEFRAISVPCPPLSEQQQIAEYLDKKCAEIDELISIKQQKIEKLTEYKKSLIYEYVTGKKEVA